MSIEDKLREAFSQFTECDQMIDAYNAVQSDLDGDEWQRTWEALERRRQEIIAERDRLNGIVQDLSLLLNPDGNRP